MRNEPSYEVPVCGRCGCAGDLDRTLRLCLPCITAETQEQTIRRDLGKVGFHVPSYERITK